MAPPQVTPDDLARETCADDSTFVHEGLVAFESGPLPAPFDADPRFAGAQAGHVCDATGFLGTYVQLEGCRPVAIRDEYFTRDPGLAIAIADRYPDPELPAWAEHGWKLIAGVIGLFALAMIGRRRRAAYRRMIAMESRKTQFQMSAIDPSVADLHATVWERGPQIVPTAVIDPATVAPRRTRLAEGTAQPPIVNPQPYVPPASDQPPAPYPLTFPAFPEAAALVMLPAHRWEVASAVDDGPTIRDPYPERDYAMQFARGSQPVERLEPIRMILPANAPTVIQPLPRRRSDTIPLYVPPRMRRR